MGRIIQVCTGHYGVVQSTSVKMAHDQFSKPNLSLAPAFYDGVCDIINRAGDVSATS